MTASSSTLYSLEHMLFSVQPMYNSCVKYSLISMPMNMLYSWYLVDLNLPSCIQ